MSGLFTFRTRDDNSMTFLEHADVFRYALMRAVLVTIFIAIIIFFFKDFLYNHVLFGPRTPDFPTNRFLCHMGDLLGIKALCINQGDFDIISTEMAGQFKSHLYITLAAGTILAVPYILWEIWMFVKPALFRKESRGIKGFVFYATGLFMIGVSFGYFIIAPLAINFLTSYVTSDIVTNRIALGSYVGSITSVCLAAGLIFELPIVIYFLSRMGIVGPEGLRKFRKHSVVSAFIISAIITPPDLFSQVLVALPLIVLYEISILVSKRVYPKETEEQETA